LEIPVQLPSSKAESVAITSTQSLVVGPAGFLTEDSIKGIIHDYGIAGADKVDKLLQIFATATQRTWLASTQNHLYCLLDDPKTRKAGRVIQWVISKSEAEPIKAQREGRTLGTVAIDDHGHWYYSANLFPDPKDFEKKVRELAQPSG